MILIVGGMMIFGVPALNTSMALVHTKEFIIRDHELFGVKQEGANTAVITHAFFLIFLIVITIFGHIEDGVVGLSEFLQRRRITSAVGSIPGHRAATERGQIFANGLLLCHFVVSCFIVVTSLQSS